MYARYVIMSLFHFFVTDLFTHSLRPSLGPADNPTRKHGPLLTLFCYAHINMCLQTPKNSYINVKCTYNISFIIISGYIIIYNNAKQL